MAVSQGFCIFLTFQARNISFSFAFVLCHLQLKSMDRKLNEFCMTTTSNQYGRGSCCSPTDSAATSSPSPSNSDGSETSVETTSRDLDKGDPLLDEVLLEGQLFADLASDDPCSTLEFHPLQFTQSHNYPFQELERSSFQCLPLNPDETSASLRPPPSFIAARKRVGAPALALGRSHCAEVAAKPVADAVGLSDDDIIAMLASCVSHRRTAAAAACAATAVATTTTTTNTTNTTTTTTTASLPAPPVLPLPLPARASQDPSPACAGIEDSDFFGELAEHFGQDDTATADAAQPCAGPRFDSPDRLCAGEAAALLDGPGSDGDGATAWLWAGPMA